MVVVKDSCPTEPCYNYILRLGFSVNTLLVSTGIKGDSREGRAALPLHRAALVSAGIELIFFLVAGIVLCFGFSMRRMLITH